MRKSTQRAKIYRAAASIIVDAAKYWSGGGDNADCCCIALGKAEVSLKLANIKNVRQDFARYFQPNPNQHLVYWWAKPHNSNKDQEARRLALLFMAEIVSDPDQARYA